MSPRIDKLETVLAEMHEILLAKTTNVEEPPLKLQTAVGIKYRELAQTSSPTTAFFAVLNDTSNRLAAHFFGTHAPQHGTEPDIVWASANAHSLIISITATPTEAPTLFKVSQPSTILETNFDVFTIWVCEPEQLPTVIAKMNRAEFIAQINLVGSLWSVVHPFHYGIFTRTISYTCPDSLLTDFKPSYRHTAIDRAKPETALRRLGNAKNKVVSLEEYYDQGKRLGLAFDLIKERRRGAATVRRYQTDRSSIFNFGTAQETLSREDDVASYVDGKLSTSVTSPRDYVLMDPLLADNKDVSRAYFDILVMLGYRREKLFRSSFAKRVFNFMLPPLILAKSDDPLTGYCIVPLLNLYTSSNGGFRRTFSLATVVCPVRFTGETGTIELDSRSISMQEACTLKKWLGSNEGIGNVDRNCQHRDAFTVKYSGLSHSAQGDSLDPASIMPTIAMSALKILFKKRASQLEREAILDELHVSSCYDASISTALLQVTWQPPDGYSQPWEKWLADKTDKTFREALFRTLFYQDYVNPSSAYASREVLRFEDFNVGNTLGADMTAMTLYNPQDSVKTILYPQRFERYPNYSVIRYLAWQIYIDSALTALKAIIFKFKPVTEDRGDLRQLIDALDEMMQEFGDFYDLEIREFFYRKEYERLRGMMQVDSDYKQIVTKFADSKTDESLREQRLINKLIVSLTAATVTITVVSTLAQMGKLEVPQYLTIALALSTVMVWIGYMLFDPFRRMVKRFARWRKL